MNGDCINDKVDIGNLVYQLNRIVKADSQLYTVDYLDKTNEVRLELHTISKPSAIIQIGSLAEGRSKLMRILEEKLK